MIESAQGANMSVMFAVFSHPPSTHTATPRILVKLVAGATEELIKFCSGFKSQGRQINYFSPFQTEVAPFSQHDRAAGGREGLQ